MADFLTSAQLIEHYERVVKTSEDPNELLVCRQTIHRLQSGAVLQKMVLSVNVAQGLVQVLEDDQDKGSSLTLSAQDRETITHWIALLLKFGDSDLKEFTNKLASKWLSSYESGLWESPVPAEYAYKQSKGER